MSQDWYEKQQKRNTMFDRAKYAVQYYFDVPTTWFKATFVTPYQKVFPYYHRRFKRVPTIDQCDTDDIACAYEANEQFKRDKLVDNEIIKILRQRYIQCQYWENVDGRRKCEKMFQTYLDVSADYFCKYGDLGRNATVLDAFMKQKHRMIFERRKKEREAEGGV